MTDELKGDPRFPGVAIHESAYVDEGVSIGANSRIWHFAICCRVSPSARDARSDRTS